jgi:hypothetical protein
MMKYVILYPHEQWPLLLFGIFGRRLCDKTGDWFEIWFEARWQKKLAKREAAASAHQSP